MSDALDQTGCIQHKATARYFTYYEDYQELSKKCPDKLAAFLRVLEVKTNKRLITYESLLEDAVLNGKNLPELNLWLEISYNDFVYWSLKTMGRSSFQMADKEAESMLFAKSRVCYRPIRSDDPESPRVQYKEYLLVFENVQAAIDDKDLPITEQAYEQYGNIPPVLKNIPLLQKTWDMLQKTREGMLQKTYPPVAKNRLINKDTNNISNLNEKHNNVIDTANADVSTTSPLSLSDLSLEELQAELTRRQSSSSEQGEKPQEPAIPTSKGNAPRRSAASTRKTVSTGKSPIVLSSEAQAVYDEWCKMPWFKVKPDLTETLAAHCETAKAYSPTAEIMLKVKNYATSKENDKKGFYKSKGWNMKFFLNELPKWLAVNPDALGSQDKTSQASGNAMTHDEALLIAQDAIEKGKKYNYDIKATAHASGDTWAVSITWDGFPVPAESRAQWEATFKENLEYDQQKQQKGAR